MAAATGAGVQDATQEIDKKGAFVRTESTFRGAFGTEEHPVEAGRAHLYVSYACPWACRCLFYRAFFGLEDAISVDIVAPEWGATKPGVDEHRGWLFDAAVEGATGDSLFGQQNIRGVYEAASGEGATHKFTVPMLVDKVSRTIVNNESSEIIRQFNTVFRPLATKNQDVDLYPEELRSEIDAVNAWVYPQINNGVYRCGFAKSQEAYEEALTDLHAGLDRAEALLSRQRYLVGDRLTEADVRLVVTLWRHDDIYQSHFKTRKMLRFEYPNLFNFAKEMYQLPGVAATYNETHCIHHYYGSHPSINPFLIIPRPLGIDWSEPHNRASVGASAAE